MPKFFPLCLFLLLFSCQEKSPLPETKVVKRPQVPPVATVEYLVPSVTHRTSSGTEWKEATQGLSLNNKDELKTADGASTTVKFFSGKSRLEVGENSFVVIWDQERKHIVALPDGSVRGTLPRDEKIELEVRTPAGWVKAASTGEEVDFKINTESGKKAYKLSVMKGETIVETAKAKATVKAGGSIRLMLEDSVKTVENFMEVMPLNTFLLKEKKFRISFPLKKEVRTKDESITFNGILEGNYTVWANGTEVEGTNGKFAQLFHLVPGLNVITFQVSDADTRKVEYFIYKITRLGP